MEQIMTASVPQAEPSADIWCAIGAEGFNPSEYIYHYTSFQTALAILFYNRLRLSPLSKTNDTTEQKVRIDYNFQLGEDRSQAIVDFEKYWTSWTTRSKLLCFAQDPAGAAPSDYSKKSPSDVSGRGFALPRMWAQYAMNNSGVCLIIHREKLLKVVSESYPHAICDSVSYYDLADSFKIDEDVFNRFVIVIRHNPGYGFAPDFLREQPEFAKYSYFSKFKDWEGEREFRILLPNDDETEYFFIEGIKDCLSGVVLGEYMDASMIYAIRSMLPDATPIRKIVFRPQQCAVVCVDDIKPTQ